MFKAVTLLGGKDFRRQQSCLHFTWTWTFYLRSKLHWDEQACLLLRAKDLGRRQSCLHLPSTRSPTATTGRPQSAVDSVSGAGLARNPAVSWKFCASWLSWHSTFWADPWVRQLHWWTAAAEMLADALLLVFLFQATVAASSGEKEICESWQILFKQQRANIYHLVKQGLKIEKLHVECCSWDCELSFETQNIFQLKCSYSTDQNCLNFKNHVFF